jgi:hypothetical protein
MSTQSNAEKNRLNAAWLAHPEVVALEAAVAAFVAANPINGADGMTAAIKFSTAWVRANESFPEDGIIRD